MTEKIVILDFGSQYTQLIARRLRELNVFCEIYPYNKFPKEDPTIKAVVLSGSPFSVLDEKALYIDVQPIIDTYPVLGVCYGAQLIAHQLGGHVKRSEHREYGKAKLSFTIDAPLWDHVDDHSQVWMSHGDTILDLPEGFEVIAKTRDIPSLLIVQRKAAKHILFTVFNSILKFTIA